MGIERKIKKEKRIMSLLLKNNSPKGVSFGAEIFCVLLGLFFLVTGFFGNYIGFVIAAIIFLRQFARFCERASGTTEGEEVEEEYDETTENASEKFKYYELINYIIIAVTFYYYLPKIMKKTDAFDGLIFAIIAFCGAGVSLKVQKIIYLCIVVFIQEYKKQE